MQDGPNFINGIAKWIRQPIIAESDVSNKRFPAVLCLNLSVSQHWSGSILSYMYIGLRLTQKPDLHSLSQYYGPVDKQVQTSFS